MAWFPLVAPMVVGALLIAAPADVATATAPGGGGACRPTDTDTKIPAVAPTDVRGVAM